MYNKIMNVSHNNLESIRFDLQDYNHSSLNGAGELDIGPSFRHPIFIAAGADTLELSRVTVDEMNKWDPINSNTLLVLHNLSSHSKDASIILDTGREEGPSLMGDRALYRVFEGRRFTIGREDTPQLDLSDTVSAHHFQLRLGSIASGLHISDLYSTNGTFVDLHPYDAGIVSTPARYFYYENGQGETLESRNQQWSR